MDIFEAAEAVLLKFAVVRAFYQHDNLTSDDFDDLMIW
jgi:hypothetical protein